MSPPKKAKATTDKKTITPAASRTAAQFEIPYRQILNSQGTLNTELPKHIGNAQLLRMYRTMMLARLFDKKAINLQRTGKLGTYASCLGHEAIHVAMGSAMKEEDCLAPMYREYGAQLWRGVKMEEILLYWGGDERGNDFSGPKHDFPWCVPIATQCLYGAGAAMAFKTRKEARCVVCAIGDGGTSEGAFYEAINLAGAANLPIVFVVINNQWAISVPRSQQSAAETLAQKGIAGGMPALQVDGNDVVACRNEMHLALARARKGLGPTLIEAVTYRLSDHTTADDASRYREQDEVGKAWEVEPLIRVRKFLTENKIWSDDDDSALQDECNQHIELAVQTYLDTPAPSIEDMFRYMYANLPDQYAEQMATAQRYAKPSAH